MVEEKKQEEKTSEEQLVRCFICLELPREAMEYVEEIQNIIKKKNLFYGKLTELENLHLTLKFIGEVPESKIKEIQEKLRKIKILSFEASLGDLGYFSRNIVGILWMKLYGKGIFDLQSEIDKSLEDFFPKEERFMSHLTIARIKKVLDSNIFLDYIKNMKIKKISFPVCEFVLKKSELKSEGPVYGDIERFKLE